MPKKTQKPQNKKNPKKKSFLHSNLYVTGLDSIKPETFPVVHRLYFPQYP